MRKFNWKLLCGILGVLVVVAVVLVCILGRTDKGNEKEQDVSQNSVASATERPTATKEPVVTPTSTPVPTSTPAPTPTPIIVKTPIVAIATNYDGTAALYEDGTVYVDCWQGAHEYKKTEKWSNIISISAGSDHLVGLDANGKVFAVGMTNFYGECDVEDWTDIVAISTGFYFTIGLKADGTVVMAGTCDEEYPFEVSDLSNIVKISSSGHNAEFLTSDGLWIARGRDKGEVRIPDVKDIFSSMGNSYGLKEDGKVVMVDNWNYGATILNMPWENVKEISGEVRHILILMADGTVRPFDIFKDLYNGISGLQYNEYGQCNVSDWTDIVAISAEWGYGLYAYSVGLKSDGTVVATGSYYGNRACDVSELNNRITKTIIPTSD